MSINLRQSTNGDLEITENVQNDGISTTYVLATPEGTTNISENGTYDVTQYTSAVVNVEGFSGGIANKILTITIVNEYGEVIPTEELVSDTLPLFIDEDQFGYNPDFEDIPIGTTVIEMYIPRSFDGEKIISFSGGNISNLVNCSNHVGEISITDSTKDASFTITLGGK